MWLLFPFHNRDFLFRQPVKPVDEAVNFRFQGRDVGGGVGGFGLLDPVNQRLQSWPGSCVRLDNGKLLQKRFLISELDFGQREMASGSTEVNAAP